MQLAFADQLREDVWKMIGWRPKTDDEYEIFKNSTFYSNSFGEQASFTGRELLQRYGTEVRRAENEDVWGNRLITKLEVLYSSTPNVTVGIPDCRFDNEIKRLIRFQKHCKRKGVYVELNFIHTDFKSDRYNSTSEHESEKLAQQFVDKVFVGDEFNKLIFEMYGN